MTIISITNRFCLILRVGAVPAVRIEADSLVYDSAEPGIITFVGSAG
jgi:hypothetical protein